ncbi:MAG TPA: hypothetical protein VGM76_17530 [Lacipirellulaceae bacterium]|jgi:hypothetical protein
MGDKTAKPNLRFSLLTALLLTAIVAMAMVIMLFWREIGPLRSEVRRLRNEVGTLSIDDETKPCAIRVRTVDDFTWKWRLWIPKCREYLLKHDDSIPKQGFPAGQGSIALSEPGEIWIEYRIAFDPRSKTWQDKLTTPSASVGGSQQDWVNWSHRTIASDGVSYDTQSAEPGKVIVLASERVSQASSSTAIEDPSEGLMIWLEPTK